MFKESKSALIVLGGALFFNLIFWGEKMGLNTLFFALFTVATLWYLRPDSFSERRVWLAASGVLLTAFLVVWHNSYLAKFIHLMSLPVLVGFVHSRELRFVGYAFLLFWLNLWAVPRQILQQLTSLNILRGGQLRFLGRLRLILFPILILPVFYIIYYIANPKFTHLSDSFWTAFFGFFDFDWQIGRVCFFLWGLMVVGAIVWQSQRGNFVKREARNPDKLDPEAYQEGKRTTFFNMTTEDNYRNSLTLLASLNVLTLLNNILDINYVWLGNTQTRSAWELKQYVHEGTYFLIFGILLAIAVLVYLFRGAINFHKNSPILRGLAYAWLAQNAFLALSVGCRNWEYIAQCGLAYKRIGVFIFLLLTLIGLYFLYLKIRQKQSFFFVMRRVGWAFYGVLIAACFINWDVFISAYNIKTPVDREFVDVRFLMNDISSKNLPLLYEHKDSLKSRLPLTSDLTENRFTMTETEFDRRLSDKTNSFINQQNGLTIFSWNASDAYVKNYLKNKGLIE